MSLDTLDRLIDINTKVTLAWANLLCLAGPRLSTDTVLSAVKNLISAAGLEDLPAQHPEQATANAPSKHTPIVEDDMNDNENSALPYCSQAKLRGTRGEPGTKEK